MRPHEVATREDLVVLPGELASNLRRSPEAFPNAELAAYLDGASGWVNDMEGYFLNRGEAVPIEPSWALVASIFVAAANYE